MRVLIRFFLVLLLVVGLSQNSFAWGKKKVKEEVVVPVEEVVPPEVSVPEEIVAPVEEIVPVEIPVQEEIVVPVEEIVPVEIPVQEEIVVPLEEIVPVEIPLQEEIVAPVVEEIKKPKVVSREPILKFDPDAERNAVIQKSVKDYVREQSMNSEGTFNVLDDKLGAERLLMLSKLSERAEKGSKGAVISGSFKDQESGEILELNFDVEEKGGDFSVLGYKIRAVEGVPR